MSHATLKERFNKSHQKTIKRLNNIYISADMIISILTSSKEETLTSPEMVFNFPVPSTTRDKIRTVKRKKDDFLQFLDDTISFDLYKYMIIAAVSLVEDYLASNSRMIFKKYPRKLTANSQTGQTMSISKILDATDLEELIDGLINEKIFSLFYGSPQKQFEYFERVFQFSLEDKIVNKYIEIKATRDLLVHADGIVNQVYLDKARDHARALIGEKVILNESYFQDAIRYCKKLIGQINKQCINVYC